VIVYTIASLAYLPHARVLARSYSRHHAGEKIWVLLIDDVHGTVNERDEPFRVLRTRDLPIETAELHRLALLFGGKLIATIKPWIFRHFLSAGADAALYIDSDFMIYDSLDGMVDPGGEGVILVPHLLSPLPRDGKDPDETSLLGSGMYNAGMFGVSRRDGGFVEFLMERLSRECIFDPSKMRFNEQRWLDFVPSLFPYLVVRDPGIDVAYWNLHERPLSRNGETWSVGGVPLRAFHFSSFDPRGRGAAGRYEWTGSPRIRLESDALLTQLCNDYGSLLYAEGFAESQDRPFAYDILPDGTPVYESMRALFRRSVLDADAGLVAYPPDPFDPLCRSEFDVWASEQYLRAGLSLPRRLGAASISSVSGSNPLRMSGFGSRLRTWFGTGRAGNDLPDPSRRQRSMWAIDLMDRMIVEDAGVRHPTFIEIVPECSGFVCHGPRIPLGSGSYVVTLEFDGEPVGDRVTPQDQALVFEGFVQGYAVGSVAATFSDLLSGRLVLDVQIPENFVRESVLYGLELRLLTRGHLHARLAGIVLESVERLGHAVGSASAHHDWLPVMAGGQAGRRAGVEVMTKPGATGVVVAGPNWRLLPGAYRGVVRMRTSSETGASDVESDSPVAVVEVGANERILASESPTIADLRRGYVELRFVIEECDARPNSEIGVRVRSLTPVAFVVSSVVLDNVPQNSEASASVA
jgi:hypothetical protein